MTKKHWPLQRNINLGKKTNQNFVNIPLGNIKEKLEYLCEFYGIEFLKQEESCIENQIGKLVIGYAETLQRNINLGKKTNQNFVNIPLGNIKEKLEYLCEFYGIEFLKQEE
ncbi:hypothetical protein B9L21_01015 [Geobacillus uzenensis]|uniref:Uncharacterized protein n=1 Tax=Geobacillus uzenensis TaxID=129339 RepID=A0ABX4DMK6_9BACL|nr:hypothetical protein B9L21_01015 [Geobacillus uzenensis]